MLDEDEDEAQTDDARRVRSDDDEEDVIDVNVVENAVAFVHITHSLTRLRRSTSFRWVSE